MLPNDSFHFANGDKSLVNPHYVWFYQLPLKLLNNTENKDSNLLQLVL